MEPGEVAERLEVDPDQGLSAEEARRRRRRHGPNRLREAKRESTWSILIRQFTDLIILILVVAMGLAFAFGQWVEGLALAAVILANGTIGFITELRAIRSMEALRQMSRTRSRLRRGGEPAHVQSGEIVPGDVVLLEAGDVVPADLRVIEARRLEADESALTGESVPVAKTESPVEEQTELAERASMLYKGTSITRGSAVAIAVGTGMATELGGISEQVEQASTAEHTPLERRLHNLGKSFIWLTVILSALVAASGLITGRDILLLVKTAIALAVAAVPESLPIVSTLALARGMRIMARRNALVNRLSAVETLGSCTAIFTDKTGTLTENRMAVTRLALPDGDVELGEDEAEEAFTRDGESIDPGSHGTLRHALRVAALCNNAEVDQGRQEQGQDEESAGASGDPMERALLLAARRAGLGRGELEESSPRVREVAFEHETMMMATFHEHGEGGLELLVKGAAEAVLEVCTRVAPDGERGERELGEEERQLWNERADELAAEGLRLLALARREAESEDEEPYRGLTLLGFACLLDPPREEVAASIHASQNAGTRVVMVTGDQPATARAIAERVGLVESAAEAEVVAGRELKPPEEMSAEEKERVLRAPVFARVNPEQKLHLIAVEQEDGDIVAMTGDGVNDAPALEKADIGVAMGRRGTQVAREAADMVLQDDAFSTIVTAIEQGRIIFANIRKFVIFLLSISLSMIAAVFVTSFLALPLAVKPLQVLFLNAVTHVFPALALGVGSGRTDLLERPPRDPDEPIIGREHWIYISIYGLVISAAAIGALWYAAEMLGLGERQANTVSFAAITLAQLVHVFNVRDADTSLLRNEVTANRWVWIALAVSLLLLIGTIYIPPVAVAFETEPIGRAGWTVAVAASLIYLAVVQTVKELLHRFRKAA
jgi:Ca2+-transporting ATPase